MMWGDTRAFLPDIGDDEFKHREAIRKAHLMAVNSLHCGFRLPDHPTISRDLWTTLRDHAEASWLAPATLDEIAEAAKLCRILWQAIQIAERRDGIMP